MISVRLAQMARKLSDDNKDDWGGPIFAALIALCIEGVVVVASIEIIFT